MGRFAVTPSAVHAQQNNVVAGMLWQVEVATAHPGADLLSGSWLCCTLHQLLQLLMQVQMTATELLQAGNGALGIDGKFFG